MKKFTTFLFSLLITASAFAQMPSGSIAPNFTGVDINGNSWNLYDILNSGKSVIMDVSATWCGPCWAYHQSGALEQLYDAHGPAGDDKLMVLWVEGDPTTNTSCLSGSAGCNNTTQGNWVANTGFPIIDDATIGDLYQIAYFPTIYLICPNRIVTEPGQLSAAELWTKASECSQPTGANNAQVASLKSGLQLNEFCGTAQPAPSFYLINMGTENMTSATISMKMNGNPIETINWTGDLASYGNDIVNFNQFEMTETGSVLVEVLNVNGAADADISNNSETIDFTAAPSFNKQKVVLKIKTDPYGEEFYWELHDDQGNVLDHGGNEAIGPDGGGQFSSAPADPSAYAPSVTIRDTLLLPANGCYSMLFVDGYGDGLCSAQGNGYYKMYNIGSAANVLIEGTCFGATEIRPFGTTGVSNVEDVISTADFDVYPSPASDILNVDYVLNKKAAVQITITNTLGQVVKSQASENQGEGYQLEVLKINDLARGIYLVNLRTEAGLVTKKFVKN
jgi:Secretion system C-terminal sorting domain